MWTPHKKADFIKSISQQYLRYCSDSFQICSASHSMVSEFQYRTIAFSSSFEIIFLLRTTPFIRTNKMQSSLKEKFRCIDQILCLSFINGQLPWEFGDRNCLVVDFLLHSMYSISGSGIENELFSLLKVQNYRYLTL